MTKKLVVTPRGTIYSADRAASTRTRAATRAAPRAAAQMQDERAHIVSSVVRFNLRPRLNGRVEEEEGLCAFLAFLEILKQA